MHQRVLVTVFFVALAAAPVNGQTTVTRTYTGCDAWSCHTLLLTVFAPDPDAGPNAFIDATSWFFPPEGLGGFVLNYLARFVPIYERGEVAYADRGMFSRPVPGYWTYDVSYGPVDGEWPDDELHSGTIRLTSTIPEPATLLLLGTGLAGIAGAARRRRRI